MAKQAAVAFDDATRSNQEKRANSLTHLLPQDPADRQWFREHYSMVKNAVTLRKNAMQGAVRKPFVPYED